MALTKGMLERFQSFVSQDDNQLMKVELSNGGVVFGYLREVSSDFFVIEELEKRQGTDPHKIGKKTMSLEQVEAFSEIPLDQLPTSGPIWV